MISAPTTSVNNGGDCLIRPLGERAGRVWAAWVMVAFLIAGMYYALHRPIFGDETLTLGDVNGVSFVEIATGKLKEQANPAPLFYLFQKVAGYKLTRITVPPELKNIYRLRLRINSILSVVFLAGLLFYYFARHHSLGSGLFAVILVLTSHPVWLYAAEGRPFAQWMFLSGAQLVVALTLCRGYDKRLWRWLAVAHACLALTTVLAGPQIIFVSLIMLVVMRRPWQDLVWVAAAPVGLCAYYYLMTPRQWTMVYFGSPVWDLIFAHLHREHVLVFLIFVLTVLSAGSSKALKEQILAESEPYLMMCGAFVLSAIVLIGIFKLRATAEVTPVQVQLRYFMLLTPAGIVLMTACAEYVARLLNNMKVLKWIFIVGIVVLVVYRGASTLMKVEPWRLVW